MMLSALLGAAVMWAPAPWAATPPPPPMPEPTRRGLLEHDGARLAYAAFGHGPPLILLHGGAGNSEHWSNQVPALAPHFEVFTLDSRGHGRSTRTDAPLSYHQLAEDVVALLDHLQLARASVVGWSDGGIVALDMAIHHPERLERVVLFGANFDRSGMKHGTPTAAARTYFDLCAKDYARLSPTPEAYPRFFAALRLLWRTQPAFTGAQLKAITTPTLVLDGAFDELIQVEHTRSLASLIPGAELRLLPEAGHFAPWQSPAAFNRALLAFLLPSR